MHPFSKLTSIYRLLTIGMGCFILAACQPTSAPDDTSRETPPQKNIAAESNSVVERSDDRPSSTAPDARPAIHVHPGEEIQPALEKAAQQETSKTVIVHEGTYRPSSARQALLWLNARHNGIHLKAAGKVVLTAANPDIATRSADSFPAVVNHVIYCGDGVGPDTVIEGFTITGANGFTTTKGPVIEAVPKEDLERTPFHYLDGGGIKLYGRAYPTLERLEICDNYASPCGAGISVEHRGFMDQQVVIRNCIFRNNRVPLTGAALDLLGDKLGSRATVENCLFVNNASNCSMDSRSLKLGSWMPQAGHGAITVFAPCQLTLRRCTLTQNRNGVDDSSPKSIYQGCLFWKNSLAGGWAQSPGYHTALHQDAVMRNCYFGGGKPSLANPIDNSQNQTNLPDPEFDQAYVPQNAMFKDVGFRPSPSLQP